MTLTKTLILYGALGLLASCGTLNTEGCAGWRQVQASAATVDYLAANDHDALKSMIAHDEFGRAADCW